MLRNQPDCETVINRLLLSIEKLGKIQSKVLMLLDAAKATANKVAYRSISNLEIAVCG